MLPYLIVSIMPVGIAAGLFVFLERGDQICSKRNKKIFLLVCGSILFLFLALRDKAIGSTDTINYYNRMLRAINSASWAEFYDPDGVEVGFQIFVYFLSRIFKFPQALLFVTSAFYVLSVCRCIYKNSDDVTFSLVMYITLGLMTFHMQGMRQSIAMCICLWAYEFAKSRKFIPFCLLVLLATTFHQTAIVFFIIYFSFYLKFNLRHIAIFCIVSVVIVIFSDSIMEFANKLFDREYTNNVDSGGFIATVIYILILVLAFLVNRNIVVDLNFTAVLYVTMIGLLCYILRYTGVLVAERISFYFMFGQFILLPNTLTFLAQKERFWIKSLVYILMILLFMYRLIGSNLIPYRFL